MSFNLYSRVSFNQWTREVLRGIEIKSTLSVVILPIANRSAFFLLLETNSSICYMITDKFPSPKKIQNSYMDINEDDICVYINWMSFLMIHLLKKY